MIQEITEQWPMRHQWNTFVADMPFAPFQQTFEWALFQKKIGRRVFFIGSLAAASPSAGCIVVQLPLALGFSFLYCPRGPLGKMNNAIVHDITSLSTKTRALFFRYEPFEEEKKLFFQQNGYTVHSTIDVQPSETLILDLTQSEEELLSAMHPKTRYNIGIAKKHGIRVSFFDSLSSEKAQKAKEHFLFLLKKTARRNRFFLHERTYYELLCDSFMTGEKYDPLSPSARLYCAFLREEIISFAFVFFFGSRAWYLHGASADSHKNCKAPALLQWSAVQDAKNLNCNTYDLCGIAPRNERDHFLKGVTRFKKGFGGQEVQFPGTFDLVLNPLYTPYAWIRKGVRIFNRMKRLVFSP